MPAPKAAAVPAVAPAPAPEACGAAGPRAAEMAAAGGAQERVSGSKEKEAARMGGCVCKRRLDAPSWSTPDPVRIVWQHEVVRRARSQHPFVAMCVVRQPPFYEQS